MISPERKQSLWLFLKQHLVPQAVSPTSECSWDTVCNRSYSQEIPRWMQRIRQLFQKCGEGHHGCPSRGEGPQEILRWGPSSVGPRMDISRILCQSPMGPWTAISLGTPLPATSCTPPVPIRGPRTFRRNETWNCLRLHAVGFAVPRPSPERAVRSYRTFSPLPATKVTSAVCSLWHFP